MFETALATVADAVIAVDNRRVITYLNAAAETMTGWRSSEALGCNVGLVFPLIDDETQRSPDATLRFAILIDRQNVRVGIEYQASAVREADGTVCGAVIVCRPRRREVEHAFEEKERAQVTLNSIGDAVVSTTFSGRVHYLNVVAEKMTCWTQEDSAGNAVDAVFRLVDAATRESIACPTARAIIEDRRVSLDAACVLSPRDGQPIAVEVSAAPIHDRIGGVIGAVMVVRDVTAARERSQQLTRLALHDSLTDLPNRALFTQRLREAMVQARKQGRHAALLYVDLDRFKHINDSLGHAIGDKLLQTVSRRLLGCVRSSDTVSRHGGDEFAVLLPRLARKADAVACAENILKALQSPYRIGDRELLVTASIGIAVFPDDAQEGEALLRCADLAMYRAKGNGRNNVRHFG